MGTKLEYTINPLATNINSKSLFVNEWDIFRGRRVKETMDKNMLEKHNLDSIKRTMQMHEDTFKHQVRELHRVYRVQKMLMSEVKKEMEKRRLWMASRDHQLQGLRERSTGSCSGDNMRMQGRGFDFDRPEEDMSTAAAGPSRNKLYASDDDSEVELTLSIGGSMNQNRERERERELHSSASFKAADPGRGDCSDPTTPMSSSSASANFDQQRKRPHWLFQGLSLNSPSN